MTSVPYIGKKGYTIFKKDFTQTQLQTIRNDLTVRPNTGLPGFTSTIQYPIYRESTNRIYLPRYYGIDNYGKPLQNSLSPGDKIDVSFQGTLFDYQNVIVDKCIQ